MERSTVFFIFHQNLLYFALLPQEGLEACSQLNESERSELRATCKCRALRFSAFGGSLRVIRLGDTINWPEHRSATTMSEALQRRVEWCSDKDDVRTSLNTARVASGSEEDPIDLIVNGVLDYLYELRGHSRVLMRLRLILREKVLESL